MPQFRTHDTGYDLFIPFLRWHLVFQPATATGLVVAGFGPAEGAATFVGLAGGQTSLWIGAIHGKMAVVVMRTVIAAFQYLVGGFAADFRGRGGSRLRCGSGLLGNYPGNNGLLGPGNRVGHFILEPAAVIRRMESGLRPGPGAALPVLATGLQTRFRSVALGVKVVIIRAGSVNAVLHILRGGYFDWHSRNGAITFVDDITDFVGARRGWHHQFR